MKEADLGLEVYLTQGVPGIGGKLRKTPEDFEVEEISILPPRNEQGKYVIARIWRRNWETNRLIRRLASNLKVGRARIGFAGTKDGRAVATQLMSFNAPLADVQALSIPDVKVLESYLANRMISIGDLIGNRFRVRVSGSAYLCMYWYRTVRPFSPTSPWIWSGVAHSAMGRFVALNHPLTRGLSGEK